ncbi:MAG: hypothetical protein ACP5O1_10870 [Phycisphaerae bacterium]
MRVLTDAELLRMKRKDQPLCLMWTLAGAIAMLPMLRLGPVDAAVAAAATRPEQNNIPATVNTKAPRKLSTISYHNNQELNRILVKVTDYQPGAFYVRLIPQRPTAGPPLLALPNLTLEKLIAMARKHPRLVVSGRVSTFGNRAYLLLDPNIYRPSQFRERAHASDTKISRRRASHERASMVLSQLLSHSISAPASEHIVIRPATKVKVPLQNMNRPGKRWAPAVAQGTYIWNRMGRLLYDPILRQWVFVFLSDGRHAPDPPVILMPSPQLQEMQNLDKQAHSRAILRISGIVSEFRHHNFLMPTYVQLYHNLGRY